MRKIKNLCIGALCLVALGLTSCGKKDSLKISDAGINPVFNVQTLEDEQYLTARYKAYDNEGIVKFNYYLVAKVRSQSYHHHLYLIIRLHP